MEWAETEKPKMRGGYVPGIGDECTTKWKAKKKRSKSEKKRRDGEKTNLNLWFIEITRQTTFCPST